MQKTSNVLLTEYASIDGKLNEVIKKPQEVLLEETIIRFAQNVELLFGR